MPTYLGDIRLGDTIDFKFSTVDSTGAPATLSGSPAVAAYPGNSTTEITAGITLTVDFDSRTGLNNVRIVATGGNGYATATNYAIVITAGTSGGTSVVGYTVGHFSIEARSAVMPTTAARTLGVDASGRIDLGLWLGTAPASLTSAFYVKADVEQWIGTAPSVLVGGNVQSDLRAWRGIQPNSLVSGQVQASDSVASGTVTSATASTIVVPVSSGAANLWRGLRITIRGAPGTGQSRLITADDGAGNLTIAPNWITNPTSSSLFTIDEWSGVDVLTWLEGTVNALISGRVDANTQAMGTDAISAAAVSQAAANKVADSQWRRHTANVVASSDGDSVIPESGVGVLRKAHNKVYVSGSNLLTTAEDGTTTFMTQALGTTPGADPITSIGESAP